MQLVSGIESVQTTVTASSSRSFGRGPRKVPNESRTALITFRVPRRRRGRRGPVRAGARGHIGPRRSRSARPLPRRSRRVRSLTRVSGQTSSSMQLAWRDIAGRPRCSAAMGGAKGTSYQRCARAHRFGILAARCGQHLRVGRTRAGLEGLGGLARGHASSLRRGIREQCCAHPGLPHVGARPDDHDDQPRVADRSSSKIHRAGGSGPDTGDVRARRRGAPRPCRRATRTG